MRITSQLMACAALVLVTTGCRARPMPHTAWTPRFGPVLTTELIVGRIAEKDDVWFATSLDTIVHVDLGRAAYERIPVRGREPGEHLWGLARYDGRSWSLLGRHQLVEIAPDGQVAQRIPLASAHVGVFSGGSGLLYQVMDFKPPADALTMGPPGETNRRPWGNIKTRSMPLERGAVAALNLLSCGSSSDVPCWFPDEAALTVLDEHGGSRRLELEGLPTVDREVLLASEAPRKPIRDAFVAPGGEIWVIGSGSLKSKQDPNRPGGWLLATYSARGEITRRLELPEPVRLILRADQQSCLVLTWNGFVVEVRP
jgi:hypothetical protein